MTFISIIELFPHTYRQPEDEPGPGPKVIPVTVYRKLVSVFEKLGKTNSNVRNISMIGISIGTPSLLQV